MADIQTLLDQALAPTPSATPTPAGGAIGLAVQANLKKSEVAQATTQKQNDLGAGVTPELYRAATGLGTQLGANTMPELEADLRTMNPVSLYLKYGASAQDLTLRFAEATRSVARDNTRSRDPATATLDAISGIASGAVNSLGGIAALGAGAIDQDAGAAVTGALDSFNQYIQEGQSPALESARRSYDARSGLTKRDNAAQLEQDIAEGENPIYAGLKRWNSDVANSLEQTIRDPRLLSEGTAQGVGSLLGASAITSGLKKIGTAVLGSVGTPAAIKLAAALDKGTGTLSVARAADAAVTVGSKAAFPLAVGAMEAGGVYQQTLSEVLSTPFDSLERTSEEFRTNKQELVAQGFDEDTANAEARSKLANDTALHAAAIQAPIAVAASTVSRLGERPFHVPSVGQAVKSALINEPLEEGIQGTTGQLSQNYAQQNRVDASKRLSENVGEQTAQGALYGLTSAGAVQGPALGVKTTLEAGKTALAGGKAIYQGTKSLINSAIEAGKPLFNAIVEAGDKRLREQQNASPVGDAAMSEAASGVVADAPQASQVMQSSIDLLDATDEQKAEGKDYVSSLVQAMQFDGQADLEGAPDTIKNMIGTATNRVEAIQLAARAAARASNDSELMSAAAVMYELMQPLNQLKETDPEILDKLPKDSPARKAMIRYEALIQNIDNNFAVQRAFRAIKDIVEKNQGNIAPVTEETIDTDAGQQSIKQAIAVAGIAPDQGNPEVIEGILRHATEGRLNLTPDQRATLNTSLNLLRARQAHEAQIKTSGLASAKDVVSSQIVSGNDPLRTHAQSALQHTQGVLQAYRSGNLTVAQARLEDFGLFVQHMKNKVEALNTHFANGNPNAEGVPYDALMPVTREFKSSLDNNKALHKSLFVNTSSPKSLDQAQSIELEQKTLADVYNGLVDSFPELNANKIEPLALPDALHGNPQELARKFRTPVAKAVAEPKAEVTLAAEKIEEAVNKPVETSIPTVEEVEPVKIETPVETKVEAKPEPVVETVDKPTEIQQEKKPASPMDTLYPKLLSVVPNYFKKVFKLPSSEKPISRLIGQEGSVVSLVQTALSSEQKLSEFIGKSITHDFTSEIANRYKQFLAIDPKAVELWKKADAGKASETEAVRLQNVGGIMTVMESRLQQFLNSKYDKSQTMAEALKAGVEVNRFVRGKALNIVDEVDSKYQYNPELIQSTALAAMQWLLTSDHYETVLTEDDVASLTGLNPGEVSNDVETQLSQGMSIEQAKRTLADKIRKYWGVVAPSTEDMAYTEGIPEAVAAEAIRALVDLGMLRQIKVELTEADGLAEPKTIYRYTTSNDEGNRWIDLEDPIRGYNTAIDDAVLTTPDQIYFINGDIPPVAERQMNNPDVKNTPEQKTAIKNEQQTPFYLHAPVVNFYRALGVDGLINLLGGGPTEGRTLNKNHKASLEGKNRTIYGAYDQLLTTVSELNNRAVANEIELSDTSIRYGYNVSRVGRLQMLGKYNPQASKLVREAILPTWSTLDLVNNSDHKTTFGQALAQALGIKVHRMTPADAVIEVTNLLTGSLAPAVDLVRDWVGKTDLNASPLDANENTLDHEALKAAMDTAGVSITANALHALVEYVRFNEAVDTERSSFKTPLYLEADGVTNGPINAMALMSIGEFTTDWVNNVAKGGFSFGGKQPMYSLDKTDLYQTTTQRTSGHLANLISKISNQKNSKYVLENVGNLLNLMSMTLPDVQFDPTKSFDEGNALTLQRGIAKNPLTITIYGSSAGGIAGKLTSMVTDSIYEMLSDALTLMGKDDSLSMAQALFPDDSDPEEKAKQFFDAINNLTESQVMFSKEKNSFYRRESDNPTKRTVNPETFTFTKEDITAIQQNMLEIFVNPMRSGIEETVGSSLTQAVTQVRQATQVQSIVTNHLFTEGVYDRIAQKDSEDKTRRKGDFLSRSDLNQITKDLGNVSPLVRPNGQVFFVVKSQEMAADSFQYGRALDGTLRTGADFYAPGNSGVAGIPFLTIGMGDGKMMQNLALDTTIQNTLKIFDGMNMPLDKVSNYGEKANQAVYDSWKGNPLRAVKESYDNFMSNGLDTVKKLLDQNAKTYEESSDKKTLSLHAELTRALGLQDQVGPANSINGLADTATIMDALGHLQTNLNWSADSIDARHQAIQETSVSVDQMAAPAAPFTNNKNTFDANPTNEEVVQHLNTRYIELMNAKKTEPTVEITAAPVKPTMATELSKVGSEHSTGARVLSFTALKNLGRLVQMTEAQKVIYDQIMRSLGTKEYKVIAGTQQQITDYQKAKGLNSTPLDAGVNGVVSIADRTIYLLNPSIETLVHELVHASTYETLLAHYNGENVGAEVKDAIARLEIMMNDFMSKPVGVNATLPMREALNDARASVQTYLDAIGSDPAVSQAGALNEFMAWALTNPAITEGLKNSKVNPLVQLAKDVIKAIKQMIWGKKLAPKPGDDFLSNIQFNASVIIRTQPSLAAMVKNGTLYHAQNKMTDRLRNVREAFSRKVADIIKQHTDSEVAPKDLLNVSPAFRMATDLALKVQAIFGLSQDETHTFQLMVGALATEADIDPNALARAQELYVHVTKNLKVEDFVPENAIDPESERYYAQQKYDVIMGKSLRRMDAQGRTTMLPVFMALATTNDEFRAILEGISVPKSAKNTDKTLDAAIENAGSKLMDTLSTRLSGENAAPNVRAAIDNLNTHIHEVAVDEQTLISEVLSKTGGISDSINDWMVGGITTLSDKGMELGNKLTDGDSKASKVAGNFVKLISAMATEQNGAVVAEDVIASTNKMNMWRPMREFINGLVGRTSSNADVYDMIKRVRAMVQQLRQNFRDEVPRVIASKFSRVMSESEYSTMFKSLGKTDLAVLRDTMSSKDILNLFNNQNALDRQINDLESLVQQAMPATKYWGITKTKMQQLAHFMNTGETGSNLLRNTQAIANLLGEGRGKDWRVPSEATIKQIDKLVTLYAIDTLADTQKADMASLVQDQFDGLSFALDYLVGQRKTEMSKALQPKTQYNYYKGHIQSDQQTGVSLIVENDTMAGELRLRGYTRIGDYVGSDIDTKRDSMGYYFAPLSGRTAVSQGIMQNVKHTASGVDSATGMTSNLTAGHISEPIRVKAYAQRMNQESHVTENLVPVYDEAGKIISFERSIDPKMLAKLNKSEHLANMLGVWRGRQIEERLSSIVNEELIDNLYNMYQKDLKESSKNQAQYVNVFGKGLDTVQKDVINLFSDETKDYIRKKFGDEFFVRKDLLEDVIGFRNASVGDFWTGNSRFSKNTNDSVTKFIVGLMGINAYKNLVKVEQILQNVVSLARTNIVVRSVIIPAFNAASNAYQLISRGVPIASIIRGAGSKVAEIDHYAKSRLRQIQLEAELRTVGDDVVAERKLRTEIKSITDSHKRMSIWPLINAGEFSTVADVGMSAEDLQLTSGDLQGYIQQQVDKLPDGLRTAARYGLLTRDTALFQGLQKAVHYGDFVAKAILYDDLTKRKGLTEQQALARVTEEFVNYDRLSSRSRTYLENMGLMWFYNYKIRIAKVALSTLRNNPFHALVSASMPAPNSVGLPIQDNVFSKAAEGSLGWSLGPDMAVRGMGMNPWYNLVN